MNDGDEFWGCLALLIVGPALFWLFIGTDFVPWFIEQDELVNYTITCSVPYKEGECNGEIRPGLVTRYKINRNNNEVVVQAGHPGAAIRKLVNCTIFDAENWSCPTVFSPAGVSFKDGFPNLKYRTNGTVKHVSGWKHRFHRALSWVGWSVKE